jgi:hypothetical protein
MLVKGRLEMRKVVLNLPTFGMAVATRAAFGAGVGLLLADRIGPRRRRGIGVGLVAVGVLTTIPVARAVLRGMRRNAAN